MHEAEQAVLARAQAVDKLVLSASDQAQPPVTVVAVGGYGRRELFPYSDVDLLLLSNGTLDRSERDRVSEFLRILWDGGLQIGHSVRTPAECCEIHEGNLELTISLLDRRAVCGDESRFAELSRLFPKFVQSERSSIIIHLCRMTRARHAKYGNTIYHLEPNVKEYPGGLRDLHVMHWLGLLRPFEMEPLDQARAFLFQVRIALHKYFGRDNNVLSFEAQEALSADPANWMRDYYRHARQIDRAVELAMDICVEAGNSLFTPFRDWRSRLSNSEFTVSRERVLMRNPGLLATDPSVVFRLMLFLGRHQLRLAPDTERRLREAPPKIHVGWSEFRELLSLPRCALALRTMADLGLLQQIIPEWRRIDCLVIRDFYHRYTVDEHTLVTIQALEELAQSDLPPNQDSYRQRFASLLAELDHPELLRLALLLHDIGKGSGEEHARKSVEIARDVMARLHVPATDRDTVAFLIAHHLDLSSIMTTRDLSEISTARQLADQVESIERLKLLTLITYADISAVNPTAMTPWRLERLWQVYSTGYEEFTRELESERIRAPEQTSPEAAAFLEGFPTRYLKTHTDTQVEAHLELAHEFERRGVGLQFTRLNGTLEITVVAADRPFLFASLSGAIASFGLNILKAEAFANRNNVVLDSFIFEDPHRTIELNPEEGEKLQDVVRSAAVGKVDAAQLVAKRRRRPRPVRIRPSLRIANDVSESSTLLEIVAEDRPLLLYDLAYAISASGANIEVVLIDTEANRALDVFYITESRGKLSEDRQRALKAKLLEVCSA